MTYVVVLFQGPYNIGMRKFETCEDEGTRQIKFPTKIYAVGNGVHELNGPFYLEVPFDDITQVHLYNTSLHFIIK